MNILIKLIITGLIISFAAYIVPGVGVENFWWAIIIGITISLVNLTIGKIIRFLTIPLNIISLGLIGFFITLSTITLAGYILPGFTIGEFWSLLLFSGAVGILECIFGMDTVT